MPDNSKSEQTQTTWGRRFTILKEAVTMGEFDHGDMLSKLEDKFGYDFELSEKTIKSDLEFLSKEGCLCKCLEKHKFTIHKDTISSEEDMRVLADMLNIPTTSNSKQALSLSLELLRHVEGTDVVQALNKINNIVNTTDTENRNFVNVFQVKKGPEYQYEKLTIEFLNDLMRACREKRTVEVKYRTTNRKTPTTETVDPYKIVLFGDAIYLHCYKHSNFFKNKGFRLLNLKRFASVELKKRDVVEREPAWKKDNMKIDSAFGILTDGNKGNVIIRFNKNHNYITQIITEKKWHETAKIEEKEDSVILTMEVLVNDELARWILSFGNSVESVEPLELREKLQDLSKSNWL